MAVHDNFAKNGRLITSEPPRDLHRFVCRTTIKDWSCTTVHLIGVYAPDAVPTMHKILEYLATQCTLAKAANHNICIGGDWNAVLNPSDRSSGEVSALDGAYIRPPSLRLASAPSIQALSCAPLRTHRLPMERRHTDSRIDDVLTLQIRANAVSRTNMPVT